MFYITEETLDKFIKEDVPYLDLTTSILGIGEKQGTIHYYSREKAVVCGTEEVERIAQKFRLKVESLTPSGTPVSPNDTIFQASGRAEDLHQVWKVAVNILEYGSGIATRTRRWVDRMTAINPEQMLLTTRKGFPGTKELAIKGVLAGGGYPHRLGLSETVLIFKQHLNFLDDPVTFETMIPSLKRKACEKKILAEVESLNEAVRLAKAGIDGVQFDKVPARELSGYVVALRDINPDIVILAAGGINESNIEEYAATDVNALVT